jgi:hypothetical protein
MSNGSGNDVITVLTTDHREVEQMFAQLEQLGPDAPERQQLTEQVITELVRHSVAEEAYLYPATRRFVPGGDQIADHELAEHAEAEKTMKELEGLDPSDSRFDTLLSKLMKEIREHILEEEQELSRNSSPVRTGRSCASWAARSRPSSRWRRPGRIPPRRTLRP